MTRMIAVLALGLIAAQGDFMANSYLGKAAPELAGDAGQWLNSKTPLTLAGLKGKVVWLEFGFLN
ncbi:MAG TPA: hypothetical protein VJB14_09235 [Planctomycetota bacterium]|nr:hypothetical protein [Planctomycetota bacterium]